MLTLKAAKAIREIQQASEQEICLRDPFRARYHQSVTVALHANLRKRACLPATAMFSLQDVSSALNDNPLNYGLSALIVFLAWPLLSTLLWPSLPNDVEQIPNTPDHYSWLVRSFRIALSLR